MRVRSAPSVRYVHLQTQSACGNQTECLAFNRALFPRRRLLSLVPSCPADSKTVLDPAFASSDSYTKTLALLLLVSFRVSLIAPRAVLGLPQLVHLGHALLELDVLALFVAMALVLLECLHVSETAQSCSFLLLCSVGLRVLMWLSIPSKQLRALAFNCRWHTTPLGPSTLSSSWSSSSPCPPASVLDLLSCGSLGGPAGKHKCEMWKTYLALPRHVVRVLAAPVERDEQVGAGVAVCDGQAGLAHLLARGGYVAHGFQCQQRNLFCRRSWQWSIEEPSLNMFRVGNGSIP